MKTRNIIGFEKLLVNQWIKLVTLGYFTRELMKGKIEKRKFFRILQRLLYFLSKMKHNKYVKIGNRIKINLYIPAFPSPAFFNACQKVVVFDEKMPDATVLISVTKACRYHCPHCYQKHDRGKDIDLDVLISIVKKIQDKGVAFFNIEGGEPFLVFDRLQKVCQAIDKRSEILINSTGDGMTYEKLQGIKSDNLLGIMFSLHTYIPGELNRFTGVDHAWATLEEGIELCHRVGIPVTFNTCLQRDAFYDGTFEKVMEKAREFGGVILQLIKPKPAGGWLEGGADKFSEEDMEWVIKKAFQYNLKRKYRNYTFISPMVYEESPWMFGCTSGATDRFYVNAKGDLQPCEFLNISFGNIARDDFDQIYNYMREVFRMPGDCLLCEKYASRVNELMKQHHLDRLPLSPELSKEIYQNWDRGKVPEFYRKMMDM